MAACLWLQLDLRTLAWGGLYVLDGLLGRRLRGALQGSIALLCTLWLLCLLLWPLCLLWLLLVCTVSLPGAGPWLCCMRPRLQLGSGLHPGSWSCLQCMQCVVAPAGLLSGWEVLNRT